MKNKCIIILSHCDNKEKKEVLIKNIEKLSKLDNFDIILTSHIPLPEYILEMVDYFVYDRSNPVLKYPERCMTFWKKIGKYRLVNVENNYGWTPLNQIKKGAKLAMVNNYDEYYFMNYDIDIRDDVYNYFLIDNDKNIFFKTKFTETHIFNPGILFFIIKNKDINNLINMLDINIFKQKDNAEEYIKEISQIIDSEISDVIVYDLIRIDTKDMFNNSIDENFNFFISNKENGKYHEHIWFWDIKRDMVINIDGQIKILYAGNDYLLKYENFVIYNNYNILGFARDKHQIIYEE